MSLSHLRRAAQRRAELATAGVVRKPARDANPDPPSELPPDYAPRLGLSILLVSAEDVARAEACMARAAALRGPAQSSDTMLEAFERGLALLEHEEVRQEAAPPVSK